MSRGKDIHCGVAKGSTWGTAVSVNSSNAEMILTNVTFIEQPDTLLDESLGFSFPEYIDAGNRMVQPVFGGWLRWASSAWNLICQVIGDDSVTGSGPYVHTMDLQALSGLFSTVAMNDGVIIREMRSFMPTGFTLSFESGQFFKFEIRGIGDRVLTSGQTNSTLSSLTARSKTLRIPPGSAQVRINDSSGSSLASGDKIYPSSLSISVNRDISPEMVAQGVSEGSGEWVTRTPEEDGLVNVEVKFRTNKYTAATYQDDMVGEDFKKMDVIWVGPAITGGNYGLTIQFPALRVIAPLEHGIDSPGRMPETVTLRACKAQAAVNGMSGFTTPIRVILTDEVSAAYDTL